MPASYLKTVFGAALVALISTGAAPAQAQAVPGATQLAPTREEIDRRPGEQAPGGARLKVEGDIERAPCALDDPSYADIKVTITEAQFNNLQGVSPAELRPTYAALLGADRPISTICTIRDVVATLLRHKGYLAAVQVPTQRIENGIVRFEVLFAKIVAVRVRGNAGNSEKLLASYLERLTKDKVFNRYNAERYLLLSRDLPGMDVRLALKPAGTVPGELVGEVSVVRTPFDADLGIQNYASKTTGRWSGTLGARAYGLLGMGDRLSGSVSSTADAKEQQIAQLGYDMRLGGDGVTIGGNLTYAWTAPAIAGADIKARTLFATGKVSYPFIRSQALTLVGSAGLDYLDQTVRLVPTGGSATPIIRDHLRVGFLRLDVDAADIAEDRMPNWRAFGSIEFRQGLDIFSASSRGSTGGVATSRTGGDPTSSVVRASGSFEFRAGSAGWIAILPRGQYAFTQLLSFEQYSGGNYSVGRGYDPGAVIGDSGIGSGVELRLNRFAPFPKTNLSIQPFLFGDGAWVWDKVGGGKDHLFSLGGGVHALFNGRFRLDATLAIPMSTLNGQTDRPDPRFLISFSTKLWPWSAQ